MSWSIVMSSLFGMASCALYDPNVQSRPVVTQCSIPNDQSSTISGRWATVPIPVAFHQGDFDAAIEISPMAQAADTWNTFFNASQGIPKVLDYGTSTSPKAAIGTNPQQTGNLCATGIISGTQFNGQVVIYKLGKWPSAYNANAMALTTFCLIGAKPYPNLYMAVMELNYQHFFVTGKKAPDLQSIVLHEFGHLLGLNHSCEASTKTGFPNCNDPNLNPDYQAASMFPTFTFDQTGLGEQRRRLGTNDESRANCLYTGPGPSGSTGTTSGTNSGTRFY